MSVFDWIVFHQNLGGFNWRLSWAKYRDGFGSISSNFWLGLERLHLLTNSQSYRLRVEMLAESKWSVVLSRVLEVQDRQQQ